MNTIDNFLKNYDITRYQLAKESGLRESTLATANNNPVNKMTVKTVIALAVASHLTPGNTLDELLKIEENHDRD